MQRIPFSQVLKNSKIDIGREYERLYEMFFSTDYFGEGISIRQYCAGSFINLPFRGTCISLDDFDESYGYVFDRYPENIDENYLINFCEYSYNISIFFQMYKSTIQKYIQQVLKVIEKIGYMPNSNKGITDFVPKNQAAISVSEIINSNLSYMVIEYNHHSMKGDIDRKKDILVSLGKELEPNRKTISDFNKKFETDLFFLLNSLNIRHNNVDPQGSKYIKIISEMDKKELEDWYDEVYQMCLLAFLIIDHSSRREQIEKLKEAIKNK